MLAERLALGLDVARLHQHFLDVVQPLRPVWQNIRNGPVYGGWSVYSASGDYRDGWQVGHVAFNRAGELNRARAGRLLGCPETDHRHPTQICTGYLADVMAQIAGLGLAPYRARLAVIRPGHGTSRHRDGSDGVYRVRLHVPIVTNPGCAFVTDEGEVHMPADGAGYLVSVARWHQAVNRGTTPRVHLFMGVRDTHGVSQHHRVPTAGCAALTGKNR